MARLMCTANGDNTVASTWKVIGSSSFIESESNTIISPTVYATTYTTFTPGAITIDGIALRVNNRTGTTGTFSVELYNSTGAASVAGTEVTVNTADFIDATSAVLDGGWMFFKFASDVTLLAATAYLVRFKTSSATQIVIYGSSATNPSKFVRTTTTQAPVAGDDRFVMGEWTGAGATTTRTVTLNDTANTDYGSGATNTVNPALSISAGGIVLAGTTASTAYLQKISGCLVVYNSGICRLGTSGGRMPSTSSLVLTFDCAANVNFGLEVRRKGEFTAYGASKTRWTTLTSDEAATATSIQVVDTTGWANSDTLLFATTTATPSQSETKSIATVDSGVQVTLSAGLTNAHAGTGEVIGEVGNLTSNIKIIGVSTTIATYLTFRADSLGVLDNIEMQFLGSVTSLKRGIEAQHLAASLNSFTMISCSIRDVLAGALVGTVTVSASKYYISNCVLFNGSVASGVSIISTSVSPNYTFASNLMVSTGQSGSGLTINSYTGASVSLIDNIVIGYSSALTVSTTFAIDTEINFSGFKLRTAGSGLTANSYQKKNFTSCDFIACSSGATGFQGPTNFTNCNFYGNTVAGYAPNTSNNNTPVTFTNCNFRGRTVNAQPIGVSLSVTGGATSSIIFNSCTFGSTVAHTTADVSVGSLQYIKMIFNNCTFASTTEFNSTIHSFLDENSSVGIQRLDTTAANHKTFIRQGIITPDTVIFNSASPSLRITPKSTTITCSNKLFTFKVPINSGQTCTPSLLVRESEAGDGAIYNGSRVTFYVKQNVNLGINSNTLLDTATASSDGAWETLTGTTSAVTDAGVLEFYVVCNGTTGWINVDDFSYINA